MTPASRAAFTGTPAPTGAEPAAVSGAGFVVFPRWLRVARLITGWNGLAWIGCKIMGLRRESRLKVHGESLLYEENAYLFGTLTQQRVEVIPAHGSVVSLQYGRGAVAPAIGLFVAGLCTFIGAMWFIDALKTGQLPLILMAFGIGLVGLAADVVLQQLSKRREPSAAIEVTHLNFSARIEDIKVADAEGLIASLPAMR